MARSGMDMKMAKTCYHSHLIPQISFRCYICQNGGVTLVIKGAEIISKKAYVGEKRKKGNVEAKKETVKKKVVAAERQVSVKKGKQKLIEGSLVSFKEGKKDNLIYCSSTFSPTTVVARKAPIFKHWSTELLKKRQVEEQKNGGFGQLPILEVLDNGNDVPEESVKDNEEINREKDVEKAVDQDVDKPEDVEKEIEFGNNELVNDELGSGNTECENDNDSGKKEVEKNTKDLIKGTVDSQSETSIFDSQPEDSQPEAQDSQPGMEIRAEIQEENVEPVKSN
ncbi:hypothetical protein Tco_0861686 [Tanacetum coccineum]|uniref:Uncharacterized protein n=1 Tax=Tanacetum coccineum TaxID=301880 RepID=A0ABQ5BK76_9ASTR